GERAVQGGVGVRAAAVGQASPAQGRDRRARVQRGQATGAQRQRRPPAGGRRDGGRSSRLRSVSGKTAGTGPDGQLPAARVGRQQVIGDLQRYGEVHRGEAAGGDGGGRIEQAEHPAHPLGDVRVLLAQ